MRNSGIVLGIAAVLLLGFAARAEDQYPNLLTNPGAEQGSEDWGYYVGAGAGKGEITDREAHSGKRSYCVQFIKRKDNHASLAVNIGGSNGYKGDKALPVKPNTTYEFSFWVKGDFPNTSVSVQGWRTGDLSAKGRHALQAKLLKDGKAVAGNQFRPTQEWASYTGTFRTGGSTDRLCIFVAAAKFENDEPRRLYVDDAVIAIAPKTEEVVAADALDAAYEKFRAGLPPQQLAWEKVLEANLGSFYWSGYRKAKAAGRETAWDYVADDPKLPRILIIGDSISRGYTMPVRHELAGKVNVHRAPANCGSTVRTLAGLKVWLGDGKWDLIQFNCGIHDRRHKIEDYVSRLEAIISKLKATGATLIWVSTTPNPVASDTLGPKMNDIAAKIMNKHGIPITDIYTAVKPHTAKYQHPNNSHFRDEGYKFMGKILADNILRQLKEKGKLSGKSGK